MVGGERKKGKRKGEFSLERGRFEKERKNREVLRERKLGEKVWGNEKQGRLEKTKRFYRETRDLKERELRRERKTYRKEHNERNNRKNKKERKVKQRKNERRRGNRGRTTRSDNRSSSLFEVTATPQPAAPLTIVAPPSGQPLSTFVFFFFFDPTPLPSLFIHRLRRRAACSMTTRSACSTNN
jgi:hypothetical protein